MVANAKYFLVLKVIEKNVLAILKNPDTPCKSSGRFQELC